MNNKKNNYKSKIYSLTALLFLTFQINAAGTISAPGYYYQAYFVSTVPTYATIFLKGPYDDVECESTRWDEYGNGNGILPWDGGPGCFYVHETNIDDINDIYSSVFNPGTDPIIGLNTEELDDYFQQVDDINQVHDMQTYKLKMTRLIDSYKQPRR